MAQQPAANQSIPLLAPDQLHPTMEQGVEASEPRTNSISLSSNTVIQPNIEDIPLPSSASPRSSSIMQLGHEDETMPLLLFASQHSTTEQQHEGREPNPRATFNSPRVHDDSTQSFLLGLLHSGTEQQNKHRPSSLSTSGELSPNIQLSIANDIASNAFAQQVEIQQHRLFSLSDPTKSSIMLRRNTDAESASAIRSSTSHESMKNLDPKRVKQLVSTLGFDEQLSEMLYKLVIATAPFYNDGLPPVPEEDKPETDALRAALDNLTFAPKPASPIEYPTATTAEEDSPADNNTENPTGTFLFDANAGEILGSFPLEQRSDSPPLLWSTAAAEEPCDPDAEDPTYFTIAEFINTILENGIQVESVTDQDWWIEEVRVAILNRLKDDASEEVLTAEEEPNEVVVTKEEATEQVEAEEDTSKSDLQRWKEQGPDAWLKGDDGTDMNDEEVDEECARWDAIVRTARNEKESEKAVPLLGKSIDLKDKGFWEFVRSSKQKEQAQGSISTHGLDDKASVSPHDQDEKAGQKNKNKENKKNKHKNRKSKKNPLKAGDLEDMFEEVRDTETFSHFLDLPTQVNSKVLGFVLVVHQELVPYHYVDGKTVTGIGFMEKPELNILLALCSSKDKKVKKCLDNAKNILYRENTFSIRNPNDLIMFLGTIGGDNVARMKMGKNLLWSDGFFEKKRQYVLELKWLARWGKDLLYVMKGYNIFRSDIAAESPEDDLTCERTDIEKALKSMVEVMKDEEKMYEMLKENDHGSGSSPMRLQSLDLGEKFDVFTEQIKTMGLLVDDGKVTTSDTAKMPETDVPEEAVESMSEKRKRKAREAGEKVNDDGEAIGYDERFLKMIASLDEGDEVEVSSQGSGIYTPSVYTESKNNPPPPFPPLSFVRFSIDTSRRGWRTWESRERIDRKSGIQLRSRA